MAPPGVGKLWKNQWELRKYVESMFGGLRDEAGNRGHRKTYMEQYLKNHQINQETNSSNPVFVLDEIDKVTRIYGDPSSHY